MNGLREILTEGVYGFYAKHGRHDPMYWPEYESIAGPFSLFTGQVHRNPVLRKAGWFNRYGMWLGWGDIDNGDLYAIKNEIPEGELFVILNEFDSWNVYDSPHRAMLPGGLPMAWPEYVAEHCKIIIEIGHIWIVGDDLSTIIPVDVLTRDEVYKKIVGQTREERRQRYTRLFTSRPMPSHSPSPMIGERAEDHTPYSGMIRGDVPRTLIGKVFRHLEIDGLIRAAIDQPVDSIRDYTMVSWFDEQDAADAELQVNAALKGVSVAIEVIDLNVEFYTVRVTKKALL